ncbi:MAG: hypothetical protein NTW99_01195, partial [Chloroflexi bacterium]|nr:hypothetical protein [Chloroflexota bacterium]
HSAASSRNQKIHREEAKIAKMEKSFSTKDTNKYEVFKVIPPFAFSPALPGTARQGRCAAQVQVSFLRGSKRFARLMQMSGGNAIK